MNSLAQPSAADSARAAVLSEEVRERVLPWLLVALGLVTRLFRLSANGLRTDEVYSLWMSQRSLPDMLRAIVLEGHDATPPTYYVLLHGLLQVSWGHVERTFPVPIRIHAYDRQGLMSDISNLLSDEGINIANVTVSVNQSLAELRLVVEVRDLTQLSRILTRIESLPNVMEARRTNPG